MLNGHEQVMEEIKRRINVIEEHKKKLSWWKFSEKSRIKEALKNYRNLLGKYEKGDYSTEFMLNQEDATASLIINLLASPATFNS